MNQCLYVCHFSNGHIKVGRSTDPLSRIAQHADRVACMGVELVEQYVVPCVGDIVAAESALINGCADIASKRFKNEWFEGLEYTEICDLANICAEVEVGSVAIAVLDGEMTKTDAIKLLGGTPWEAANALGYKSVQAVYMWPEVIPIPLADRIRGAAMRIAATHGQSPALAPTR